MAESLNLPTPNSLDSLPPNQDPSSIFYIHPSDTNVTQIVSVKFNGTGYNYWTRSMLIMLSTKNKLKFVDGSIEVPDIGTSDYLSISLGSAAITLSFLGYTLILTVQSRKVCYSSLMLLKYGKTSKIGLVNLL